jgi:hypothetical protein
VFIVSPVELQRGLVLIALDEKMPEQPLCLRYVDFGCEFQNNI